MLHGSNRKRPLLKCKAGGWRAAASTLMSFLDLRGKDKTMLYKDPVYHQNAKHKKPFLGKAEVLIYIFFISKTPKAGWEGDLLFSLHNL